MERRFTLETMDRYFANCTCCRQHPKEPITNFCTVSLKFLCPECIEIHTSINKNHNIESIKTCIKKTSGRVKQALTQLEAQHGRHCFSKTNDVNEYTRQLIAELHQVREALIGEIMTYFQERENDIVRERAKHTKTQQQMDGLRKDIGQAMAELKMLDQHLFDPKETLKAITRANKLNFSGMVSHFKQRVDKTEKGLAMNVRWEMNPAKREQLRHSLNELIGLTGQRTSLASPKETGFTSPKKPQVAKTKQISSSSYQMNPPLSADRLLQQSSFRMEARNFFHSEPFLHFFEVSNSTLHIARLSGLREGDMVRWTVLPLTVKEPLPSFHRTVATQRGDIFLVGGTVVDTMRRSAAILQFDPKDSTLIPVAQLRVPRSSHSLLCHEGLLYVVGGMTDNDETVSQCQLFDPRENKVTLIANCRYPSANSVLCGLGGQIIKMGGVLANGQSNDTIEVYDIGRKQWGEVDPTIEGISGQFGLLSCSGWGALNDNQIFVFGGYDEQAQSENSKMSFILEHHGSDDYSIKYVNQKNPPLAEGFWNQQGVVHDGRLFCLQNVDGEENECEEDKRNLLIFNGKTWSVCSDR